MKKLNQILGIQIVLKRQLLNTYITLVVQSEWSFWWPQWPIVDIPEPCNHRGNGVFSLGQAATKDQDKESQFSNTIELLPLAYSSGLMAPMPSLNSWKGFDYYMWNVWVSSECKYRYFTHALNQPISKDSLAYICQDIVKHSSINNRKNIIQVKFVFVN